MCYQINIFHKKKKLVFSIDCCHCLFKFISKLGVKFQVTHIYIAKHTPLAQWDDKFINAHLKKYLHTNSGLGVV